MKNKNKSKANMAWKKYLGRIPVITNFVKGLKMLPKESVVAVVVILFSIAACYYFFKPMEQELGPSPRVAGVEGIYRGYADVEIKKVEVNDGDYTSGNEENERVVGVRGKYGGHSKVKIDGVKVNK